MSLSPTMLDNINLLPASNGFEHTVVGEKLIIEPGHPIDWTECQADTDEDTEQIKVSATALDTVSPLLVKGLAGKESGMAT